MRKAPTAGTDGQPPCATMSEGTATALRDAFTPLPIRLSHNVVILHGLTFQSREAVDVAADMSASQ